MTRDEQDFEESSGETWLDPEREQALVRALRAAYAPEPLSEQLNELLIAQALEDPLAPPNEQELVESDRFRRALAGEAAHRDLDLVRALKAAGAPAPLDELHVERAADAALGNRRARANVIYAVFGAVAAATAMAAGIMMLIGTRQEPSLAQQSPSVQTLAISRSTSPLFAGKLENTSPTERIDRIAIVRERELRENRYAMWGVR
jgi:hypothetical protein